MALRLHSRAICALLACTGMLLPVFATRAQDAPPTATEEDLPLVKAAIVYNICKFVDWPAAHSSPDGTLSIGVAGADRSGPRLQSIAGKTVRGATIVIVPVTSPEQARACNVLFVNGSAADSLAIYLMETRGFGVLTVSEVPDFCARGGMIQLERNERRLTFLISRRAAGVAGLKLSSQLLKIARLFD